MSPQHAHLMGLFILGLTSCAIIGQIIALFVIPKEQRSFLSALVNFALYLFAASFGLFLISQ